MDNSTSEFFKSSKMKNNYDKNKETFDYLQTHSGHTYSRDTMGIDLWKLYETLDSLWIEVRLTVSLRSEENFISSLRFKNIFFISK